MKLAIILTPDTTTLARLFATPDDTAMFAAEQFAQTFPHAVAAH
jgi:hypothetical protein